MSLRSTTAMNPTLTRYAYGLAQDMSSAIAEFLAPTCRVVASIGRYKSFDDKNSFQVLNTERAIGGPALRLQFSATDGDYNCKPNALEMPIDDAERDPAGGDDSAMEQAKTKTLVSTTALSHEDKVVGIVKAGLTPVVGVGVWSVAANSPIEELDAQILAIATATGMMPNRMVIGLGAWNVVRNHPMVIARFPGAAIVGVTTAQFSSLLLNPAIEIRIGVLSKDATKFGATKAAANIIGACVIPFIASANPTQYDPSLAKTFVCGSRGNVDGVRIYRAESHRSDIIALDWSEQTKVTGAACGCLINVT